MEVQAACPHCEQATSWDVELGVDHELAWSKPDSPRFLFECPHCARVVAVAFDWSLERGSAPRPLQIAGGGLPHPPAPCILLVDTCPHDCGTRLGLQLRADDPASQCRLTPAHSIILGGYRCPRCDGEGRLRIRPKTSSSDPAAPDLG